MARYPKGVFRIGDETYWSDGCGLVAIDSYGDTKRISKPTTDKIEECIVTNKTQTLKKGPKMQLNPIGIPNLKLLHVGR